MMARIWFDDFWTPKWREMVMEKCGLKKSL